MWLYTNEKGKQNNNKEIYKLKQQRKEMILKLFVFECENVKRNRAIKLAL